MKTKRILIVLIIIFLIMIGIGCTEDNSEYIENQVEKPLFRYKVIIQFFLDSLMCSNNPKFRLKSAIIFN